MLLSYLLFSSIPVYTTLQTSLSFSEKGSPATIGVARFCANVSAQIRLVSFVYQHEPVPQQHQQGGTARCKTSGTTTNMSDILAIDYSLMSSTLSKEEIGLLQQYQALAANLISVKAKLEELNEQISTADPENVANLTSLSTDMQKALGVLSTVFKSTVHNVLLHVNSNQLLDGAGIKDSDSVAIDYMEDDNALEKGGSANTDGNNNADDDEDVDLGSGIDEETMDAVDRIQHELAMSADIHRQIADQLEINNPDDY